MENEEEGEEYDYEGEEEYALEDDTELEEEVDDLYFDDDLIAAADDEELADYFLTGLEDEEEQQLDDLVLTAAVDDALLENDPEEFAFAPSAFEPDFSQPEPDYSPTTATNEWNSSLSPGGDDGSLAWPLALAGMLLTAVALVAAYRRRHRAMHHGAILLGTSGGSKDSYGNPSSPIVKRDLGV